MFTVIRRTASTHLFVRRALAATVVLSTAFVAIATSASAQQYKTIPPSMQSREAKQLRVSNILRNATSFEASEQKKLDRYFTKYYFPRMTQYTPEALSVLGKVREGLVKQLRGSNVPAAQAHLTQLTMSVMHAISRDNYHPAVRYNAALLLGMLDQKYPMGGANPEPPMVLPAGTNELLELLEQKEFDGVKVHPSVQVGALEGLERHVRFGIDAQYADRVTKAAMVVIAQKQTDQEVDDDVNNWMKCQAARVLVRQFKAGPSQEVQSALTKMVANDKMSLEDRCCIVGLLSKMEYAGAAGADAADAVVPLGNLTKAVVDEGAEQAKEFEDLVLGNNPGGQNRRTSGRRGPQGPKLERRQLLSRLKSIASGAESLIVGLPADEKQRLQSLTELLNPVISTSASTKELDLDVAGEVIKLKDTIDDLVATWQPAPATEEVDTDFSE